MAQVVQFKADETDQERCIDILEHALERARAGEMIDVAVVAAVNEGDGPEMWCKYWGEGNYACLVAATSNLQFDLHYRRYKEAGE